ncbi:MAG: hypothetical protein WC933_00850 [Candidatus Paceibacterota bacterium]|jgi:hypothetical protein
MDQRDTAIVPRKVNSGLRIDLETKETEKIPVVKLPDNIKSKIHKSVREFLPEAVHPESYYKKKLMVGFTSDTVKTT